MVLKNDRCTQTVTMGKCTQIAYYYVGEHNQMCSYHYNVNYHPLKQMAW